MGKTLKETLKQDLRDIIGDINKSCHNHSLKIHEKNTEGEGVHYISLEKEIDHGKDLGKTHHPIAQIALEAGKYILFREGYRIHEEDSYETIYEPIHEFIRTFAKEHDLEEPKGDFFHKPWEEYLDLITASD